jgi:hypothetical protein
MYVTAVLVLVVGLATVTALAVRPTAPGESWLRLLGSLLPLSLLVAALLAAVASN